MDNAMSIVEGSFPRVNSTILETYIASKRASKQKTELIFPNSMFESKKISSKCVHRRILHQTHKKRATQNNLASAKIFNDSHLYLNKIQDEREINFLNYDSIYAPLEIKYSWQDLDNWIPPSEKNRFSETNSLNNNVDERDFECKIKYSQQVIGMSIQTSNTLLTNTNSDNENYECSVKYSWQIIGTGTQASLHDKSQIVEDDYWIGRVLTPNSSQSLSASFASNNKNKHRMAYSEIIQTSADKGLQTDLTDCRVKYSWQNLTKYYLRSNNCTT